MPYIPNVFGDQLLRTATCAWCIVWCIASCGCGGGDQLKTFPVTGRVILPDGKPLAGGLVTFQSVEHKVSASGTVDADGICRLGTYKLADGAVAGRHRAAVAAPAIQGDPDLPANPPMIAAKFNNPETSGLECTVMPGQNNEFTFQVGP